MVARDALACLYGASAAEMIIMTKDPVCGASVEVERHTPKKLVGGVVYHFCSEDCREEFTENPGEHVQTRRTSPMR